MGRIASFQTILCVLVVMLFPFQVSAQPEDLKGWNKAQWGMKEIEIENAFKGKIRRKPEPIVDKQEGIYVNLEIQDLTFANVKFAASFVMDDKTDQLREVVLSPKGSHDKMLFGLLEDKLVAKYGPVTYKDGDEIDMEKVGKEGFGQDEISRLWRFPSTTITLKYWVYNMGSGKVADGVILIYDQNVESTDKL